MEAMDLTAAARCPGIGPRPAGWRAAPGGHRRWPILGSAARRSRRPGGCYRPWRPGGRRQRPRPPRGRDPTVPGTRGSQRRGQIDDYLASVKLAISSSYHEFYSSLMGRVLPGPRVYSGPSPDIAPTLPTSGDRKRPADLIVVDYPGQQSPAHPILGVGPDWCGRSPALATRR